MDVLPFLVHNWALVLIAVVSGALLMWPGISSGATGGPPPTVSPALTGDQAVCAKT